MNNYRDLLLGWVLGVFSPLVVEGIQKHRRVANFRVTISSELDELKFKMALVAMQLYIHIGVFDRQFLVWLENLVAAHKGPESSPEFLASLRQWAALPDAEIIVAWKNLRASGNGRQLVKYSLPFFEAQVNLLSECPVEFQQQAFQIKAQLDQFNAGVDQLTEMMRMTFDVTIVGENRKAVENNLEEAYERLARRAERIARMTASAAQ